MSKSRLTSLLTVIAFGFAVVTCSKPDNPAPPDPPPPPPPGPVKSKESKLLSFRLDTLYNKDIKSNVDALIDENAKTVKLKLPTFTAVNNLVATFTHSDKATVKIGGVNQVSNVTINNFETSKAYTVIAENDSFSTVYTVSVEVTPSNECLLLNFSFRKANNSFLTTDSIKGYITKNETEVHIRNPFLSNTNFVSNFRISRGAKLIVNGVEQISGQSSQSYAPDLNVDVVAQDGTKRTYKVKTTPRIVNFDDFIKECPNKDPNIATIYADFEFRENGVLVNNFPCENPYYPRSKADYFDQIRWLQTLRILYYMDYGTQVSQQPWTSLRIYDWVKSKIQGINIVTGLSGGNCCTIINGKRFINVGMLKNNTTGNNAEVQNLYFAWAMNNFVLLLHESRHVDGFGHTGCCLYGPGNCDNEYNTGNLSSYGMHIWWQESVLLKRFDFGFDCMPADFVQNVIDVTWGTMNNQKNNFCTVPAIISKPAYWTDCRYK